MFYYRMGRATISTNILVLYNSIAPLGEIGQHATMVCDTEDGKFKYP